MTQIKKTLYFVPDTPRMPQRMRDALQVAKTLVERRGMGSRPGQKIPVFALQNIRFGVPAGVEVVNIEDKDVRTVFDATVLYSCIMTHNACQWSQMHQDNPLVPRFLAELAATGAMAAGREPSLHDSARVYQENLQAGYQMNLTIMDNAGASLFGNEWPSIQPGIDSECTQNLQSKTVNNGLIKLIQKEILAPLAGVMQDLVQEKLPAMGRFFTGMANSVPRGDMEAAERRNWLMDTVGGINEIVKAIEDFGNLGKTASTPVLLTGSASAISRSMSALNSLSYAYVVAKSDFGEGVMNVPWDGKATLGMINTLRATGIDVKPEE